MSTLAKMEQQRPDLPSQQTTHKVDTIEEIIVLKMLDVKQQSTAIMERQEIKKMYSMAIPAYCLEIVSISTEHWQNTHSSLMKTSHIPK